jgi:hypothetical protein
MECKIDHTLEGAIPVAICRVCNPIHPLATTPLVAKAPMAGATGATGAQVERYDRKVKRKLRAEVKAWRERVAAIERYTMAGPALMKARETLRKAETDLYMVA